jgi:hypothetical protein
MSSSGFCARLYNSAAVVCPLCGQRKARRACPAVGKQICAVCCGTKRLVQIQCPADCVYLATARDHPPAAQVRRQQHDLSLLVHFMRDLSERQSQLFFLVNTFLIQYEPPELQPLIDGDVAETAAALAATLETSTRGVIYEHRPASLPAERLMNALKPVLAQAGGRGGTAFERDAAVVLRRIEEAARQVRSGDESNRRAFLDLLGRVMRRKDDGAEPPAEKPDAPRLILP